MFKDTAHNLKLFLSNYYALFAKTQGYHWNIQGEHFLDLHVLFEKQYQFMHENIDELAERLRAIGVFANTGLEDITANSVISDGKLDCHWREIIKDLINDHKKISKMMYDLASISDKEGDIVTNDLIIEILSEHEKHLWIMNSLLENKDPNQSRINF